MDKQDHLARLRESQRHTRLRVRKSLMRLDAVGRERQTVSFSAGLEPASAAVCQVFSHFEDGFSAERLTAVRGESAIPDLARIAGGRARQILLEERWYKRDLGPIIARFSDSDSSEPENGRIVALIHDGRCYRYTDHETGKQGVVNGSVAARIQSIAFSLYPPLPERPEQLRSILRFLWPDVRRDVGFIILAGGIVALMGALTPLATKLIVDTLIPGAEASLLTQVGVALGVAAFVIFAFDLMQDRARLRIEGRSTGRLQAAIWDRVLRLPAAFFKAYSAGDLNARVGDVEVLRENLLNFMLSAVVTVLFSCFYLVLLFLYLPALAVLALALVVVLAISSFAAGWLKLRHIEHRAQSHGRLTSLVFQFLLGIVKLRVASAEGRAFARWADQYANERLSIAAIRRIDNHYTAFADAYQTLALAGLFGATFLFAAQDVSAGIFIAFLSAYAVFQSAFLGLSRSVLSIFASIPYLKRARPLLVAKTEQRCGAAHPGQLKGAIQVSQLCFAYNPNGEQVLQGLSFDVEAGEHVAIVGSSGSGKSTLLRVLLGFETPQAGTVLYDGQDLASLDIAALRRQVGVVLQTGRIFAGSIVENIRGASDATLDQCMQAAQDSGLDWDLEQFSMGLHTRLTEGASTISGGQRQRILIARALVKKPRILFMDEATSALDNRSQSVVTKSLERAAVTRLVIAHRISTIRNADRILVMERGRIVENGTYDDLIALDGSFSTLASRQLV
ncbi:NHLP bacteriocin export ABC transporter permease/ATPase subunit [Lamprobacter modestohalophilus]|uniref:NHLP bacteriocin export ABC transporter permease/ATPase subunit n=1 Tax=Lamprobacter modestohalophilus TaxID=1064514 RepID=UPI002ADEC4FC|nr:NHLP bacteriocin export ABC transporter permease/ATPase subunit [Lamprobacter modestohalophilus]MEA1051736.1 NHLP bacteriocin export ABC transporter permease/ATPase subunit [Lamprobacter modestohalophilus]